jgi:hypothetical protein
MTQKEKCKAHCMEYLQSLSLTHIFEENEFERIYRNGGHQANPFSFGLSVADYLINHANHKTNNNHSQVS